MTWEGSAQAIEEDKIKLDQVKHAKHGLNNILNNISIIQNHMEMKIWMKIIVEILKKVVKLCGVILLILNLDGNFVILFQKKNGTVLANQLNNNAKQ